MLLGCFQKNSPASHTVIKPTPKFNFLLPMVFQEAFCRYCLCIALEIGCINSSGYFHSSCDFEATVQNASGFFEISCLVFLCIRCDGRGRERKFTHIKSGWFANMWKPLGTVSERVSSQHASWLELCLEWLFLNEFLSESPERLKLHMECSESGVSSNAYHSVSAQQTMSSILIKCRAIHPTSRILSIIKELLNHHIL